MYRALESFCGKVSMGKGEIGEISDLTVANDLIRAGYIEKIESEVKEKPKAARTRKK